MPGARMTHPAQGGSVAVTRWPGAVDAARAAASTSMEATDMAKGTRRVEGITTRHRATCRSREGAACNCAPAYMSQVWSASDGKRITRSFPTLAAARSWRADAQVALRRGTMKAPTPTTLRQAWEAWISGAEDGSIRNRSGDRFKPSTLRGYRAAMQARILADLGGAKLSAIRREHVQAIADRMLGEGSDPSTIRNALMPLRVIFRRALSRGEVAVNPTTGTELPAVRGRRDRIAAPGEAALLLAALGESDRALWATALYGGLRRGELMALKWEDVDLAGGIIRVERSYDPKEHAFIAAKSEAGRRRVPIAAVLREHLLDHRIATGRTEGLVFGRDGVRVVSDSGLRARAASAWVGLDRITLHECRHTFASMMIAAGVNAKALSEYLGHATIALTMDRYGHLMPGNEDEAAGLLDAYLARADTAARLAQLD